MNLNHPNIVRCYSWWMEEDQDNSRLFHIYIQMEYAGDSDQICHYNLYTWMTQHKKELTRLLNENKLKFRQIVCHLFLGFMKAIDYLHERKIVHRDIKPENIFVYMPEHFFSELNVQNLQIKIGDFGHAKQFDSFNGSESLEIFK